ncbi:MAG: diguanylate phosphodiesterase [Oligoflexia bacterium]|nr:MAG: diguanylate phosphodiesterase [Oligoflexia bacterium]
MFKVIALLFMGSLGFAQSNSKELNIALNAEFETLNPLVNTMMAAIYVQDSTLRPLVKITPNGKIEPVLLKDIPKAKQKTAQGLMTEIEFRAEANWGDGNPVTCQDLKATLEIGLGPKVSTANREDYENIKGIIVDQNNPKKCQVHFKEAKWNFYLTFPRPIPAHLEFPIYQKYKDQDLGYERNSLYVREPANPGLYNGPFVVSEIKQGSHILLKRNEKFYGLKPYFDKVIFKWILNTATIEANLRSGVVQMASSSGLSLDQALAFEEKIQKEKLPFEVKIIPGFVYSHLDLNLDHPVLQDIKVRQALAHAINRDELAKAFFKNKIKPSHHFAAEIDSWFTDDPKWVKKYEYSRAKANELLEAAGWKMGKKGIREKEGKSLTLTINSAADNKLSEMVEVFIQGAWKQVGVELQIKNYPARVLFPEILKKRKFEVGFYSWVLNPDGSQLNLLHSEKIPSEKNSFSGSNRPGWKNLKVDQWLEKVETEFESKKRIELMRKVIRAYTEELPAIPLYYRPNNSVIPKGLKNYQMSGHVFSEYLEIEKWEY